MNFKYDVGLSFAGEQRAYVEQVAEKLQSLGIRIFYDDYERAKLWGKNLYSHLHEIYTYSCQHCILFVSKDYAAKVWTNHERESAQARALQSKGEYILPVRFDDTPIPGLANTVGYIDGTRVAPAELAGLMVKKLADRPRHNYLPSVPDRLYERLGIENVPQAQNAASRQAYLFLQVLIRMTPDERAAVVALMRFACAHRTPTNIHIDVDLLHRYTGKSVAELERLLGEVRSLGFQCSVREATDQDEQTQGAVLGKVQFFDLNWRSLTDDDDDYAALVVACEMIDGATEGRCEECGTELLDRLDFSQLATVTSLEEPHEEEAEEMEEEEPWEYRRIRC